jgi:hypothetical protein
MSNGRGSVVNRTEDAGTDELREFRMAIAKLTRKGLQTDKSFGVLQNRVEKMPGKIAKDVEHMMQAKQALKAKSTPDALLVSVSTPTPGLHRKITTLSPFFVLYRKKNRQLKIRSLGRARMYQSRGVLLRSSIEPTDILWG